MRMPLTESESVDRKSGFRVKGAVQGSARMSHVAPRVVGATTARLPAGEPGKDGNYLPLCTASLRGWGLKQFF